MSAKLAEGKTKIIWGVQGNSNEVLIESKDDITAGDGLRRDIIAGKGALATQTTINSFKLLEHAGIPTHFVAREDERTFRAQRVDMLPIELVARGFAFGSYVKRNPNVQALTPLHPVTFEMFAKDDDRHDPILDYDFEEGVVRRYRPNAPLGPDTLIDTMPIANSPFGVTEEQRAALAGLTVATFNVLSDAWAEHHVTLADIKIECGMAAGQLATGRQLIVADVIDNDSWRIWPDGKPAQAKDKQNYRDGQELGKIADDYTWVAQASNRFVSGIV